MNTHALPHPGLAFGAYPERTDHGDSALNDWLRGLASAAQRPQPARLPAAVRAALDDEQSSLDAGRPGAFEAAVVLRRTALMRDGFADEPVGRALAVVACAMERTVGLRPYPTQLLAAWLMLQGRLAEMATGEGKTLAMALAAGIAAMAGVPVHVLTANDYLVQRDEATMAPFFRALGLISGCVLQATPPADRVAIYQRPVVYTTAKELGFDYLRDHHRLRGERDPRLLRAQGLDAGRQQRPLVPGLCMALVDEADSLLLDEACVPLILASRGAAMDVAALQRAFDVAGALEADRDFSLVPSLRRASLTDTGRDRVDAAVRDAGGWLRPLRRAHELVESALVARHLLHRDREYAVTAKGIALIDELTGRIAVGRQWSGVLHPMVEIKEGVPPSAPNVTSAQITYQRFFPRYLRLAGMSGTLLDSRHELRMLYRCRVARVPLAKPSRARWLGERLFARECDKWQAVIESVRHHIAAGRPVLVGTDSVAASQHLSQQLSAAGLEHQVLNAVQDADEAARVAQAGRSGTVTVATNIAGRGTDIRLDDAARAAGGLHVIAALRNRARRIDRQLTGRSARQGDPGSAESVTSLDDALLARTWPRWVLAGAAALAPGGIVPAPLATLLLAGAQRAAQFSDFFVRRQLRRTDRAAQQAFGFAGRRE